MNARALRITAIPAGVAVSGGVLVTEELLSEAHEVREKPIATLVLFGGFLTFWDVQPLGH